MATTHQRRRSNTGVNTITGEGLAGALRGASAVVHVSNSPSFEDLAALTFFETSTRNLLAAEAEAGVGHHVALSVVGTESLPDSGYLRAKLAQETLIRDSSFPHPIVHATQFFEFAKTIAAAATDWNRVRFRLCRPAHGRRRCRRGGREDSDGEACERRRRGGRARTVSLRRVDPTMARGAQRSTHSCR